jgi:hypothetical protein
LGILPDDGPLVGKFTFFNTSFMGNLEGEYLTVIQ